MYHVRKIITKLMFFLGSKRHKLQTRIKFKEYGARPDDVFIASYPKSGTTWMQMILYQLYTEGDMEKIAHISQAIPFFEMNGNPMPLDRLPSPRLFKTHLPWKYLPKGEGKYIYVVRNGLDVARSYYFHQRANMGFPGTFEMFSQDFLSGKTPYGSWFQHVADYHKHGDDPNVHLVAFEDLKSDFQGTLNKIIHFLELEINQPHMDRLLERCSFKYMQDYEDKFSMGTQLLLERGVYPTKMIRKGEVGGAAKWVDEAILAQYKEEFDKHFSPGDLEDVYLTKGVREQETTSP